MTTAVEARPLAGQGTRTLQDAYDADTSAPQLVPTLGDNFNINGNVTIEDALDRGEAAAMSLIDNATVGAFVGGGIQSTGTITYTSTTFIWALLQESKTYVANAGAGFAAFTLFNALALIRNGTNNQLVQALILNNGVTHRRDTAGTSTVTQTIGLSNAPQTRSQVAGAVMTKTVGDTAVRHAPTYSVPAGATVNLGNQVGLQLNQPVVALFGSSAGLETMTSYIGVDQNAIAFGGNVLKRGFRSQLAAATNTRAIECLGTAQSDFRGQINFPVDLVGVTYGASGDWQEAWGAAGFKFEQQLTGAGGQFRKSFPAAGRMLFDWNVDHELNINAVDGFSLGAQSGANGNTFGNFVTSARTIPVSGEWADFLLTQGGNLTVDGNNMSRVSGWVINPPSYANSTGTVTESDTLTVGGFPTSSPGVTITDRQSLHVIAGRSRFDSAMQFEPINPSALASGDTDDWGGLLTGTANNNMRHWARISGNADGTSAITGIDSGSAQDGDTFELTNIGTANVQLKHDDAGSSASNRILVPGENNYTLTEGESVRVRWDATTDRWRVMHQPPVANFGLTGEWQFDSSTTMADPGAGEFRNNNGTIGSVTAIAINDETKPGVDADNILSAIGNGDRLYIQNKEDGSEYMVFDVTSNTDNTGWHQIGGTVAQSGNNFTSGKEFIITVIFA